MAPVPAYFDTSALVKLYLREPHSDAVADLYGTASQATTHEIAFVELRGALAAAHRAGRVDDAEHAISVRNFGKDWATGLSPIGTDDAMLLRAAELAEGFALRGYDAMHLAAADRVRVHIPATLFVSFDRTLNRAARLLGFSLPAYVPQP